MSQIFIMKLLILIVLNIFNINKVNACAQMRNDEIMAACETKAGQVLLYEDNSFVSGSSFYGEVAESSSCITCSTGSSKYYPDSGIAQIDAVNKKAIAGVNCDKFCVCQADGTCYERNSPDTSIVLYPYCDGSVCSTYVLVLGKNSNDGIISVDGTKTILSSSQLNGLDFYPVTEDNLFPKVTSVSCNGCNGAKSC